jgi:hypothetical protein
MQTPSTLVVGIRLLRFANHTRLTPLEVIGLETRQTPTFSACFTDLTDCRIRPKQECMSPYFVPGRSSLLAPWAPLLPARAQNTVRLPILPQHEQCWLGEPWSAQAARNQLCYADNALLRGS